MKIISFDSNIDGTALVLNLSDASLSSKLLLWTESTYKDYDKAIDLSDKLNNDSSQIIEITPSDISENNFKGSYFIQVESDDEVIEAMTLYTIYYEECILDKLPYIKGKDTCLDDVSISLINAHILLVSLKSSIKYGFIEEANNIQQILDKFCSDCKTCGKYSNMKLNDYYDYNTD